MKSICSSCCAGVALFRSAPVYERQHATRHTFGASAARGAPLNWRASAQNRRPLLFGHL